MQKKEEYFYKKENINTNSNQIEVYFCDTGFNPLYKSSLKNSTFYFFEKDFTTGNIKNLNIDINIDENKQIRIWTSHTNIHEYLSFLYFCYQSKCKKISVVFTDEYEKEIHSIGITTNEQIEQLLHHERKLTKTEVQKYRKEWLKLEQENSELRMFEKGKVISTNYDHLNNYIEKYYNKNDISETIGKLIANDQENHFSYNVYRLLLERIKNSTNEWASKNRSFFF